MVLTTLSTRAGHSFPEILPDGRTLLFNEGGWIHGFDLPSGRDTGRVAQGFAARYIASGHLLLNRGTTLLAALFDATRRRLTGPVAPVVEHVAVERSSGGAVHAAVSRNGTLAYVPASRACELALSSRTGRNGSCRKMHCCRIRSSPEGERLVVSRTRREGERPELWLYDLEGTAQPSRLTSDGGRAPVWTPDGTSITYSLPLGSERSGIYTRSADGRGDARQIVPLSTFHWLVGWTPAGTLSYGMMEKVAADGIPRSSIVMTQARQSRHVVGPGDTWGGRLSPDGRWLVYHTLETGYFEVHVTPLLDAGTRSLIAEGTDPSWSPDGSEIYYRNGSRLMAARIDTTSGIRVLSSRLLIGPFSPPLYDDYDVHPDGTLVLVRPVGDMRGREIVWVLNGMTEMLGQTGQ